MIDRIIAQRDVKYVIVYMLNRFARNRYEDAIVGLTVGSGRRRGHHHGLPQQRGSAWRPEIGPAPISNAVVPLFGCLYRLCPASRSRRTIGRKLASRSRPAPWPAV
jgi:hypothetical protein